jgi:hypothetical protein
MISTDILNEAAQMGALADIVNQGAWEIISAHRANLRSYAERVKELEAREIVYVDTDGVEHTAILEGDPIPMTATEATHEPAADEAVPA